MDRFVRRTGGNTNRLPDGMFSSTEFYDDQQVRPTRTLSKEEREVIEEKLKQPLEFDKVSLKPGFRGGNSKTSYITAGNAFSQANEIFGPSGWSSKVNMVRDTYQKKKDPRTGKESWYCEARAMVTVTSCLGNSHTDIGMCESKHNSMHGAFEVAMKGAVSDAKKRALKCFGDALGNSLCKPEYRKAHQAYLKRQKMENARKAKENLARQQVYLANLRNGGGAKRRKENTSTVPEKVQKTSSAPSERRDVTAGRATTTNTSSSSTTSEVQQDKTRDGASSSPDVVETKTADGGVSTKKQDDDEIIDDVWKNFPKDYDLDDDDEEEFSLSNLSQADRVRLFE